MRITVLILGLFLTVSCKTRSLLSQKHKYKYVGVDSVSLPVYYILYFTENDDTTKILSFKLIQEQDGCWDFLRIGKVYPLHLSEIGFVQFGKVLVPLRLNGFFVDNKPILKSKEKIYMSNQLNGRLFSKKGSIPIP